jgi:Ni/Co efflux regulator RcnB
MHLHKLFAPVSSVAFLVLAAAAPAAAAAPGATPANGAAAQTGQPPAHATKPAADEPKKICRNIAQTNSRLQTTRVCLTREQWRSASYR